MADRKEKRLVQMLSHAGRKDLLRLSRDEALYQHVSKLLNRRAPLKLNDCRGRWVKALNMRYTDNPDPNRPSNDPPALDII